MVHTKSRIHNSLLFFFMMLGVLPALDVGKVAVPLQYFLAPIFVFVLVFVLFGWIKIPLIIKRLLLLWLLIISEVFVSGFFGPCFKLGVVIFPRDGFQYIARMLFFFAFFIYFYRSDNVSEKAFLYYFMIVVLMGMLVGVFQWLPWGGARSLAEVFTYREKYMELSIVDLVLKRVPGIAGHATGNGGVAAFTFILAFSHYCLLKEYRALSLSIMVLAVWNTVASQARMGQLTIFFSITVFYVIWAYKRRTLIKPTRYYLAGTGLLIIIILYLYQKGNVFIAQAAHRWSSLIQQIHEGGNRIDQVVVALSKLDGLYDYVFGISRFVQQSYGFLYIEVEPVNILVMYGIAGFILQYSLIIVMLIYFMKHMKIAGPYPHLSALTMASFVGLLSYQFFSLAYFFFREVYVGLFPWILMGATMGFVEKMKKEKRQRQAH